MSDSLTLFVSIFLWYRSSLLFTPSGIANSSGSHLHGECVFVIPFSTQTSSFLSLYSPSPQSRCTTHGENREDAFPCANRDFHNLFLLKQMSSINLSQRKPRYERVRGRGEKKTKNKGMIRDAFQKAASSSQTPYASMKAHRNKQRQLHYYMYIIFCPVVLLPLLTLHTNTASAPTQSHPLSPDFLW